MREENSGWERRYFSSERRRETWESTGRRSEGEGNERKEREEEESTAGEGEGADIEKKYWNEGEEKNNEYKMKSMKRPSEPNEEKKVKKSGKETGSIIRAN